MSDSPSWQRLDRGGKVVFTATTVAAGILVFGRTVWAPCFDDPGEVQVAAAVGGLGHPPGQAGVITLFRLFCLISPAPPHLTVCAVNAAFAVGSVSLLSLLQLRTGAHPLAAAFCSILFLDNDQFWHSATTPETYGTYYFLIALSIWMFMGWLNDGRAWRFWTAAAMFAFVVVNRAPTASLSLPFVAVSLYDDRARKFWSQRPVRRGVGLGLIGVAAVGVTWLSVWVRDVPGAAYNYLDQVHAMTPLFPTDNATIADKWTRFWWLISASSYDYMFHPTALTFKAQLRWLLSELGGRHAMVSVAGAFMVALGIVALRRRDRSAALLATLLLLAATAPILAIRVVSHTAMLPNLLFPLAWLGGLGLTSVISWHRSAPWTGVVISVACVTVWFTADGPFFREQTEYDARSFIARVDLESLPSDAVILTSYDAASLIYTQQVYGVRLDVRILMAGGRWTTEFLQSTSRRVFTTETPPADAPVECTGSGPVREIRLRAASAKRDR